MSSNPASPLKMTPFHAAHLALKAKMVDFCGWEMPVEYPGGGLVAEHNAVRTAVGLFDVSHMGEIRLSGPGALAAVQYVTMNDASKLANGQIHYSAFLTPEGTFVDDILVHRFDADNYLLVVNASNQEKDAEWVRAQLKDHKDVAIEDCSPACAQLALQGPRSLDVLRKLTSLPVGELKNYWFTWGTVAGIGDAVVARTGYSGEDGFEIYVPSDARLCQTLWDNLLAAGEEFGIRPCGLGARNTLRLEAAMSLYGHEISDSVNVFEAGLERWLKLDKGEFVGKAALEAIKAAGGPKRRLVALEMAERGIARDGYNVLSLEGELIGTVTSGSPSPTLKTNIALALVPAAVAEAKSDVLIEVRQNRVRARQVAAPFYKRAKK